MRSAGALVVDSHVDVGVMLRDWFGAQHSGSGRRSQGACPPAMDDRPRGAKLRGMPTRKTARPMPGRPGPSRAPDPLTLGAVVALLLAASLGACGEDAPDPVQETIDRRTFIEVYVDLRNVALRKATRTVDAAERDSVLALHEVTEDDLRLFLDAHHTEAEFMRDLWNDVESRVSLMLQVAGEGTREDG